MEQRALATRLERTVSSCCAQGLSWNALWSSVKGPLAEAIPFEGAAFAATDPTTLLPTAGVLHGLPTGYCPSILDNEIAVDDFDKLRDLSRAVRHTGILGVSTAGKPERSPRFREVLHPIGLARQIRAACVTQGGCWAWIDLYRERGRPEFTVAEARLLERIATRIADAMRVSLLFTDGPVRVPGDEAGIVLLAPSLEIVGADPVAERWLAEMSMTGEKVLPLPVQAVALRARRREALSPPARLVIRSRTGRWLVLHGFTPAGQAEVEVAVVIEPAAPLELSELRVRAFGLTPAERRVLQLTLQGLGTKEIASKIGVSPYTARDHLSHVFDKTGARSRAQLFALLAATRPAREHLAEDPPTIVQTGLARPASRDERRPSVPGASGPKPPSTRGSL